MLGRLKPIRRGLWRRGFATIQRGAERPALGWNVGDEVNGFVVRRREIVDEFAVTAFHLEHKATGAEYIHVDCADANNTFGIGFRTPPSDSTGVAHVLEHTVLCGSEQFPVRDPFFNMIKRSLNTFMNAFTASDWTFYPFSTQNASDFANLQSVYLDATFFPNLNHTDFLQEGHRIELDPDTKQPVYKGVVFNEMKGAMSDSFSIYSQALQSALFPTNTYHHNSGGEPKHIPELTHEQLRHFHSEFYHPSNTRFFSYGDLPPALDTLNKHVLDKFGKVSPNSEVALEPLWSEPRSVRATAPEDPLVADPAKQTKTCVAWMCNEIADTRETFAMSILSTLLMDYPTSPLYRALIDPNIGSGFAPMSGYSAHGRQATFSVGLSDIRQDDVDKVQRIVLETLEQVSRDGLDADNIQATLHQVELSQKHVQSNFGLGLSTRMLPQWLHGGDAFSALHVSDYVTWLREQLASGPFFQELIKKHFLNNQHRVDFVMSPDADYLKKEADFEADRLAEIAESLTEADREAIVAQTAELKEAQDQEQDVSILPTVHVSDIAREVQRVETNQVDVQSVPVQFCEQPTNGVVYVKSLLDASRLPRELQPYLPLFCSAFANMGVGDMDYREFSHEASLVSGGIGMGSSIIGSHHDPWQHNQYVSVSSHALSRNSGAMLELFKQALTDPKFDDLERLQLIVANHAASSASSIQDSGHSYAMAHTAAQLFPSAALSNQQSGLPEVNLLNDLASNAATDPSSLASLADKLHQIAEILLDGAPLRCSVTGDQTCLSAIDKPLSDFLLFSPSSKVSTPSSHLFEFERPATFDKTFFTAPIQVNNVALTIPTVPFMHEDNAKLRVAARLMRWNFLHQQIREKGGAYGGGSTQSGSLFSFYSYRDPNCVDTLSAFHNSVDWVLDTDNFTQRDIEEAQLSLFSDIDTPTPPASKAQSLFMSHITDDERQLHRERLLSVTKADIASACEQHIAQQIRNAPVCVVGQAQDIPVSADDGWTICDVSDVR